MEHARRGQLPTAWVERLTGGAPRPEGPISSQSISSSANARLWLAPELKHADELGPLDVGSMSMSMSMRRWSNSARASVARPRAPR
jgi:hypothetical protein